MKPTKFILIDTGSESNQIMMSDVGKMENGIQRSKTFETRNILLNALIRLHFSYAITRRINLPWKSIWNRFCVLDKLTEDNGYEYFIIIVNNAIHRLSVKHLNDLQEKENIHIFSLLLDPFERLPINIQKQIKAVNWERVFSFQKSDCVRYGFEFTDRIYSRVDIEKYTVTTDPKSDVYFVGLAKDRMEKIYDMFEMLSSAGLKCDFTVIIGKGLISDYQEKYPGIAFRTSRIPYSEILRRLAATKCILELCAEGQDGLTMRFYEAVFYNKLLITNNKTAKESALFDPVYMKVIDDKTELDPNLIVESDLPDYQYHDEFSPVNLMEKIRKSIAE